MLDAPYPQGANLTLRTKSNIDPRQKIILITAKARLSYAWMNSAERIREKETPLQITFYDFDYELFPNLLEMEQGETKSIKVTVRSIGAFTGIITFSALNLPQGVVCPPVTIAVTSQGGNYPQGEGTLTFTADIHAIASNSNVTIMGAGSNLPIHHEQTISVSIQVSLLIDNPHKNYAYSHAGSTHNHTILADCGVLEDCTAKEDVINEFGRRGYNFAAITDHNKANSGGWDENDCPLNMVYFWGTEATQNPHHVFFGWSKVSLEEILEETNGIHSYRLPNDLRWMNHKYDIEHNISVMAHPEDGPASVQRQHGS